MKCEYLLSGRTILTNEEAIFHEMGWQAPPSD